MASGFFGLVMAIVGTDNTAGIVRFTFDIPELVGGFSLLPVLVGLFALPSLLSGMGGNPGEVDAQASRMMDNEVRIPYRKVFAGLRKNWLNLVRSSAFGAFVGALPGEGGSVANFLAYDQAKRYSKTPEAFGKGCPDGVVASESGNNACAGGSLIPTLSLGIPGSAADAVLLGVLMVHSIPPGPALFKDSAMLVYGLFVVFFIAHFYMLGLQLGIGSKVFLHIVRCPQWAMVPIVLVMCAIGCFALNNQLFDVWLFLILGVAGYLLDKAGFPLAPVVIGLLLGGMCEDNLRQAFSIDTDWTLFFTRPISAFFMLLTVASIIYCAWQFVRSYRREGPARESRGRVMLTIALSALMLLLSCVLFEQSFDLPPGSRWDIVGSRMIPQILLGGLGVCSFMALVLNILALRSSSGEKVVAPVRQLVIVGVVFAALGLWFLAMPRLGFYPTAFVFLAGLCWYMRGAFSWLVAAVPAVTLATVYGVFTMFLRLQLPECPFIPYF
ncbi:MAG: tripartite tricarboxylate transporter permease [Duodenibacillus sp.]|nr:tripartite tricarboxylate transporter permease [Duodenibacillus sp.]